MWSRSVAGALVLGLCERVKGGADVAGGADGGLELADLAGEAGVPDAELAGCLGEAGLAGLWNQLVDMLVALARDGLAHGDLSAYNLLVHDGRLVMIDLPQVVDVIANTQGDRYLTRDAENVGRWFTARGLDGVRPEPADLPGLLRREAMLDS
jgi:RIO kinase 1